LSEPDENGVIGYIAGISSEKGAARLTQLQYVLYTVADGQISLVFPETVTDEAGEEYPIKAFGGPIGPNAPIGKFELLLQVREGTMGETPITLTIDVGSLPLDTAYWADVQVCYADGTIEALPVESVKFLSDAPLAYNLYLKEEGKNGTVSDTANSDKWFRVPNREYCAGETVHLYLKHPEDGYTRNLHSTGEPPTLVETCDDYMKYEFVMPYENVSITITDTKE
jgi:hypothetical protein